MNHERIREFSKKHKKTVTNRKILRQEKQLHTSQNEMKQKIRKVAMDKHNFFMRNNTKGNNSILAQNTHPSHKRLIMERTAKRREYEKQLKHKMGLKLQKGLKPVGAIPRTENISIVVDSISALQKQSTVFAFGSSMIASGFGRRVETQEATNEKEYRKLQHRKQMGKQYLTELKRNRLIQRKEIILGPRNTKILEEEQSQEQSTRTMLKVDLIGTNEARDQSPVQKENKKAFIILEQSTRRKQKKKPVETKPEPKKHVNYLKTIKIGNRNTQFNQKLANMTRWILSHILRSRWRNFNEKVANPDEQRNTTFWRC